SPHMLVCLHEEHAVAIAHGYGKVTGRPMGVILHSNVGLMHAAMAIFNAWCDRVPMVIVGATGAVDAARRRPWIEWIHTMKDQGGLVRPYLKWDDQPASISAALESLMRAHQLATTSPAGPTYVVLDVSLQEDPLDTVQSIPDIERFAPAPAPLPNPESIDKAAALLLSAQRPLIMMGRVSRGQSAWDARVRLAELLDARVLTDFKQGAAFPTAHALHEGVPAFRLDGQGQSVLREADVVLSLDWVDLAGTLKAVWGDGTVPAKIVHCSLDSYSHGGSGMEYMGLPPVDLPMLCEADTLVSLILPRLQARKEAADSGETSRSGAAAKANTGTAAPAQGRNGDLRTADIARALRAATLGKDICLVRLPFGWKTSDFPLEGPLDYLGYDGGAGLGSGPGMAVGGSLGLLGSGRMPIAVLGDGDFLMSVTALWTASHYELPLLIVVANNHCYNNDVAHQERVALRRERPVANKFIGQSIDGPPVDLTALARAQGFGGGAPVTRLEELAPALENAVAEVEKGGRCLVDVHIMAE
ncbi:MAG: thiamine pyrophosphate-binding protein, partial [SAR324 cluster bacterium]|nr:thiamine pyrophosphate-binding protein [SAR324 cluster bacterium]